MRSRSPSAAEILKRTRQAYRECASYEDTGEVTERSTTDGVPRAKTKIWRFSTAFVRPRRLRFECAEVGVGPPDEWERAILWMRDDDVRQYWSGEPGVEPKANLPEVLDSMTFGAPGLLRILSLLLPEVDPGQRMRETGRLVGSEALGDVECFVIELGPRKKVGVRIHIDRTSYLVLRTEERHVIGRAEHERYVQRIRESLAADEIPEEGLDLALEALAFPLEEMPDEHIHVVTVYSPILDSRIEDARFSFAPPSPGVERALSSGPLVTPWIPGPGITPARVLARMHAAYGACSSYLDTGEVTIKFEATDDAPARTHFLRFSTAFARSGGFGFDVGLVDVGPELEWDRFVIWDDGAGCNAWCTMHPSIKRFDSRDEALSAADGFSMGTARRVSSLLMPAEMECDSLPEVANIEGISEIDGHACYVLSSHTPDGESLRLWIDQDSFLLRRIEEHQNLALEPVRVPQELQDLVDTGEISESMRDSLLEDLDFDSNATMDGWVTTVATYDPTLDAECGPERFAFTPPYVGPAAWDDELDV